MISSPTTPTKPHRNTPESIARGNELLADAERALLRGLGLKKLIAQLQDDEAEAWKEYDTKRAAASRLLLGEGSYAGGC